MLQIAATGEGEEQCLVVSLHKMENLKKRIKNG